jgi:hypothetical protein
MRSPEMWNVESNQSAHHSHVLPVTEYRPKAFVVCCVEVGEVSLPDVAKVLALGPELVSPRISLLHETAARGIFPFGLRGEALTGPLAECLGIVPCDMNHGVISAV